MNAPAAAAPRVGIDVLLSRLDRVQRSASGWRADCPNQHRTRGSLSVAIGDNGAILLHCFSGCAASDVLGALGLAMSDIQAERLRDESPEGRRAARQRFQLASTLAAAAVVEREASIVLIAGCDALRGDDLDDADVARLIEAVDRIGAARRALA